MTEEFPQNPYPIVGILQNARAGVTVKGINLNTGGTETVITETDGSYIIDPANMTGGYSDGDVINIISGDWFINVRIDLENYPDGIEKSIKRTNIIIPKRMSKGASLDRGISCGYSKRSR